MDFWWNRAKIKDSEPEQSKIWEHIRSLEAKVVRLEAENQTIQQTFLSLRGFVNKKYKLETTEPDTLKEEPANDGFDFLRVNHG